ncbi:MAG: glycosyltransferase family 4 protein [Candidatus Hodarchaeota archaeon]
MNIAIILYEPYPHGMACTTRIHNYAKGLKEIGVNLRILIPRPYENRGRYIRNDIIKGTHEGIRFEYPGGTTIKGNSFFKRRIISLKGDLNTARIIIKNRKEFDAVLMVGNFSISIIFFKIITSSLRIKYIQEKSELPFVFYKEKNMAMNIYSYLYIKYIYKCFDGIIVISKSLNDYFRKKIKKNAKLLLVPIIVDFDEFKEPTQVSNKNTIVYCGTLSQEKDGILTLLRSFFLIKEKYPNVKLVIVGDTKDEKDKKIVKEMINNLEIRENVILTGYVTRKQLVSYLINARLLVLAKPSSIQSDTCFPTKLGEYLATGNPVVVTNTGEISQYLKDMESAFLSKPNNPESISEKLEYVLRNEQKSIEVGLRGKNVAISNFHHKKHAERIFKFICEL